MNTYKTLAFGDRRSASADNPRSVRDLFEKGAAVKVETPGGLAAAAHSAEKSAIRTISSRGLKVGISVLWYSGTSVSRGLMRLAHWTPKARFVVLYYHEVPDEDRARFARQMRALSRRTTVVRAAHTGSLRDGAHYVAITFDDAFKSVLTNAVPELVSRGFPATIFVPVDCLGREAAWDMDDGGVDDEVMTREELRSLPELIELGSHSLTHPHLTRIDSARLSEEITASRRKLAELLGNDVSLLAFPYGEYDDRVVGTCSRAGYERLFGIDPSPADPAGRDFVRGRVAVDPHDGPLIFYLKARGAYRWMIHASAAKRALARWRRFR
jgi:peptidoglycan/xylan/chitin deacetylase (PgdA/CDA1 family)